VSWCALVRCSVTQCVPVSCSGDSTTSDTLQHTATHCNTLQHTTTHCYTLLHTTTHCYTLLRAATHCNALQHTAKHCNTLQHTAAHPPQMSPAASKHDASSPSRPSHTIPIKPVLSSRSHKQNKNKTIERVGQDSIKATSWKKASSSTNSTSLQPCPFTRPSLPHHACIQSRREQCHAQSALPPGACFKTHQHCVPRQWHA